MAIPHETSLFSLHLFFILGTTALVAMIHKGILTVANVGDSRGIMCLANGKHTPISFDHKPNNVCNLSLVFVLNAK